MKSLIQSIKILEKWYYVECIRLSYPFVRAIPFSDCLNCVVTTFSGFLLYIHHHVCEVIKYHIKDTHREKVP